MASETDQAKTLVNAEIERRILRMFLYFVLLFGAIAACLGAQDAAIVAALSLAGLSASCRPIAA
ncbi:hypothetical protein [Singulisphaera acidiphila]|uniref:Uncharacterized protein n=1 Tax=Singulisphaera acidiphila (strain ATCC BAA-1392 / DSM 18658 / VKM B-2454 / MOB10) TaxID=886293 RepID=L0DTG1_SINAD|nr:hypothetical protein [Singulisphaera acidiphila]AGA31661.1 hypothetical protein Sinac_7630 [Singulisphaera acidiphila DSM 18658]